MISYLISEYGHIDMVGEGLVDAQLEESHADIL